MPRQIQAALEILLTVIFFASLIALGVSFPESRPHPPQPNARDHRAANTEQHSPKAIPSLIAIVPGPQTDAEREAIHREQEQKAASEAALVRWTKILAGVTGMLAVAAVVQAGLFVWQLLLMRDSVRDATKAADAAKNTALATRDIAEVTVASQRAYVKISHHAPGLIIGDGQCHVRLCITNHGHTPATVSAVVLNLFTIAPANAIVPPEPDYGERRQLPDVASFLVAGESLDIDAPFEGVPQAQIDAVVRGGATFVLCGYVDYIASGSRYRGGYARRYDRTRPANNLVFVIRRGWNYDCSRDRNEGQDWDEKQG